MDEDFDTAPNDGFDLAFEVHRINEGWYENKVMRQPFMVTALLELPDEEVRAWCEQMRALGLGGTA